MLKCEMEDGCTAEVTHIDDKGFIYCRMHGEERKLYRRCRKLTAAELRRLEAGLQVARY